MEIDEALRLLNHWWVSGRVKSDLTKTYRRPAFNEAYRLLGDFREVVILAGLRRVGKSTVMYQIIDELLKQVTPVNIVYFTMDYGATELVTVLNGYKKVTGTDWKNKKIYFFIDEIQMLDSWGTQVKLLYDAFPNIKMAISGSASLQLEREAMDSLAGRHFLIDVEALSLVEYYLLRHDKSAVNAKLEETDIWLEFDSYIRKPFPELAKIDDEKIIHDYIAESVIAKIVSQDLVREFRKVDVNLLSSLLEIFFSEPGMTLNLDSLSRTLAKRKQEVERHVYMLEFSKLIRIIKNYRPSKVSESRKLRKVYPYEIALAFTQTPNIAKGLVLETLIMSRLNVRRYWTDGHHEVDALLNEKGDIVPVEIKVSSTWHEDHVRSLKYFLSKFKLKRGVLMYNGKNLEQDNIRAINVKDLFVYGYQEVFGK